VYLLASTIAAICIAIVAIQLVFLAIQFGGSLLPDRTTGERATHQARCAVVVPAHNERGAITEAVRAIRLQLNPADRVLVVADNCSDETAKLAAAAGADTIERTDQVHIGKGYALDFGISHLEAGTAPDVVVFMDADCIAAPGCISRLVNMVSDSGRPVQGKYLMHASSPTTAARLAEFTYKIKNDVRPTGGSRFGFPSLLHGTAMALPWDLIRRSSLATGNITEDLKLAIDLSLLGFPPLYCPIARCDSDFPESESGMATQQTRWQHGYFASLFEYGPRLVAKALTSADWKLFVIAVDLSVPPLSLMLAVTALMSAFAGITILFGADNVLALIATTFFPAFALLILFAWFFHGSELVSAADLTLSVRHVMSRFSILWGFITRPQTSWVRTERKEDR
jgi:cellulose synthase/poly-beta-1,6-N-acetylglucosamine synthase-like glycosyltransferase